MVGVANPPCVTSHHVEADSPEAKPPGTPLLHVHTKYRSHVITAIVDSGSEVNLIKCSIWQQCLGVPVDISELIVLTDTSRQCTTVTNGYIPKLEIEIGWILTVENYWISDSCPPDILLRRGWQ
ncbi:hypothetical protein L210DRAFT_866545 [Boletus edulis BED1]|uniref:Uncharacterized protein n=1 Tax=Boletus edulis BED1 TaxID=1328754 RepID=A0AAD4BI14_BOLED|nr:hypothetical protein L210DRAFT_866545 [Boletus edulis BED1]